MKRLALAFLLTTTPALAQSLASTPRGVVVAHDATIELIEHGKVVWRTSGTATPGAMVTDETRAAVLDPINNEVRIIDLRSGREQMWRTGETPIAGVFLGDDLFIISRDSRRLERYHRDGTHTFLPLDGDAAFLQVVGGTIYVYSRLTGTLTEISAQLFAVRRVGSLAPFASAMEIDRRNAYLVYPREGKIAIMSLETMKTAGEIAVGAVPVALAFAGGSSALATRTLAVADPAAKKMWFVEGAQSTAEAFTRGFVRGLLGLGLYSNRTSQFPTGVDRVWAWGSRLLAYDSAGRALYRVTKNRSTIVATGIGPHAFAMTPDGIAVWRDSALRTLE